MAKKSKAADQQDINKNKAMEDLSSEEQKKEQEQDTNKEESADEPVVKEPTAEEKLADLQDRYLRLSAEFDNYRKRTIKEKGELIKSANEELLGKLLPVSDDFERALVSIDKATDIDALKTGVHLIFEKYFNFLRQQGIKEIEAMNMDFDTDHHEAVTKIPAPSEEMKGKVIDVIEKGYFLNDKILRFAKVVVGE